MEVGDYASLEKQVEQSEQQNVTESGFCCYKEGGCVFQLKQLDSEPPQSVETLYVMKSRPLKDGTESVYKAKAPVGQQREDLFHEVRPRTPAAKFSSFKRG